MESKILWWPFLLQNKGRVVIIIVLGLLAGYCTLLLPLSIGKYMEIVFGAGSGKTRALQLLGIYLPDDLWIFFTFFTAVLITKFFSSWAHTYLASLLGEAFVFEQRQRLFDYHIQQTVSLGSGKQISVLIPYANDLKTLQQVLVKGVLGLLKDVLFLMMAMYILFALQATLTVVVGIMIGLFFGVHRWYNQVNKPVFLEKRKRQSTLLNYVAEVFNNHEQYLKDLQKQYARKTEKLQSALNHYHAKKSFLTALTPLMLYMLLALIMIIISWGIGPDALKPGEIITYILLLMILFPTIRGIIRIEHVWVQGNISAKKFIRTLDNNTEDATTTEQLIKNTGNLLVASGELK